MLHMKYNIWYIYWLISDLIPSESEQSLTEVVQNQKLTWKLFFNFSTMGFLIENSDFYLKKRFHTIFALCNSPEWFTLKHILISISKMISNPDQIRARNHWNHQTEPNQAGISRTKTRLSGFGEHHSANIRTIISKKASEHALTHTNVFYLVFWQFQTPGEIHLTQVIAQKMLNIKLTENSNFDQKIDVVSYGYQN